MNPLLRYARVAAPPLAWMLAGAALIAQPVTTLDPEEENLDEADSSVVRLSTFEVNTDRDTGWGATNSIGATRLNQAIREIPMGISVVTEEFMRDIGAQELNEIVKYTAGATPGGDETLGTLTLRGFGANYPFRNGIKQYYMRWSANVDRVEILRGPAAVAYGQSFPGGIVNYITKKPREQAHASVFVTADDHGQLDTTLDIGGPLGGSDMFGYRIGINRNDSPEAWKDKTGDTDRLLMSGSFRFRPNSRITLDLDVQDDSARYGIASGLILNSTRTGFIDTPRDNNYLAENSFFQADVKSWTADLKVEILPWLLSRTIYQKLNDDTYVAFWGPNQASADGLTATANPGFQWQTHDIDFYRQQFVATFEAADMNHQIMFGFEADRERYSYNEFQYAGATPHTGNFFNYPQDWQQMIPAVPSLSNPLAYVTSTDGRRANALPGTYTGWFSNFWLNPKINDTDEYYITYLLKAFQDRLNLLAGARHTTYKFNQTTGGHGPGFRYGSRPGLEPVGRRESDLLAPQLGASWRLNDTYTLYALYSESLFPTNNRNVREGELLDPENGVGSEVGVKFELMERRLSGTFTLFQVEKTNIAIPDPNNGPNESFVIPGGKERSRGVEFEALYSPTRNWSMLATYAFTDAESRTDILVGSEANANAEVIPAGTRVGRYAAHKLSAYTKYAFTEGALDGFNVRGGAVYTSDRYIGTPSTRLFVGGYTTFDVAVGYKTELFDLDWRFDVNVLNVTDKQHVGSFSPGNVFYGKPRTIRVSVGVEF